MGGLSTEPGSADQSMEMWVEQTISGLCPGDHLCCIYEDAAQQRDVAAQYLSDGLKQGQKILYVYDQQIPDEILARLSSLEPGASGALTGGQLVICRADDFYCPNQRFEPREVIERIIRLSQQAADEGYPALRIAGEMAWVQRFRTAPEPLIEFEARLNELASTRRSIVLCQYDRRAIDPLTLLDIVTTHPKIALGFYVYNNYDYTPAEINADQDRSAARLDRWLSNLTRHNQMEWQLEHTRRGLSRRVDEQLAHLADANEQLYAEINQRLAIENALLQANEALRESERRYRTIFNAATDAIFIQEMDGRFIEANQVACDRFGYRLEEMVGMRPEQLVAPEFLGEIAGRLARLRNNDDILTFETVHITRDGRRFPAEVNSRRIKYENGDALLSIARDITERKRAEQSLLDSQAHYQESEAKFRSLIKNSPDGITLMDENAKIVEFNRGCEITFGIPAEQALGRSPTDIYFATIADKSQATPAVYAWSEARLQQVCQTGQGDWLGIMREYAILRPDGEQRFIQTISFPIPTERGFMIGTIDRDVTEHHWAEVELAQYRQRLEVIIQERTTELNQRSAELNQRTIELQRENLERQEIESELRESESRYRALVNQSPVGIMVVQDGRYVFVNPACERRLGYAPGEMVNKSFLDTLPPEMHDLVKQRYARVMEAGLPNSIALVQFLHKDGSGVYSETNSTPISYGGRPAALVISQDVTERIRHEQQLEAALAEKEVMLREIHHRVKNNLNVFTALIDLQKAHLTDPQVQQVFKELQTRAYTMALVHESLYRTPNLARIDFSGYLQTLVDHLQAAYGPGSSDPHSTPVALRVEAEPVALRIEMAIPCGLIVNELVTNALKYAFPVGFKPRNGAAGEIVVRLARVGLDRIRLCVADNGVGLPAELDWQNSTTLGLQLIQVLARQLGGEVELNRQNGVTWKIVMRGGTAIG